MAKVIGFVNQKGGVGKTTSTINVARYLAEFGKRVLLVDLDPQGNASSGLGIDARRLEKNLYHAMILGLPPQEIILRTETENLHIIPAAQDLAGAEIEMVHIDSREFRLRNVLRQVRQYYDYILIDSPPSLGLLTVNGLVASDEVVIPVQTEYYALEGLSQLLGTIELVREHLMGVIASHAKWFPKCRRISPDRYLKALFRARFVWLKLRVLENLFLILTLFPRALEPIEGLPKKLSPARKKN